MKTLCTAGEVIAELGASHMMPCHAMTSTNYPDMVAFDCGCGRSHRVNDPTLRVIAVAIPVKFLFACPYNHVAFVQVKGILKQRAISLWTCSEVTFHEAATHRSQQ